MSGLPIGEDDLHGYVDDALPSARRAEVEAYLADHPEVSTRVARYGAQNEALRALYAPVASEPIPVRLNPGHIRSRRPPPVWQAAAACLLLTVGAAGGWLAHGAAPRNGIGSLAQEGLASYAVYAPDRVRPVEIKASDREALVAWASTRLGAHVTIPDLTAAGYDLMGGRVVVTPHGPAIMIMYADATGGRVALVSRPMAIDKNAPMKAYNEDGIAGYVWSDNGLGYSLFGRESPEALNSVAKDVRRQIVG